MDSANWLPTQIISFGIGFLVGSLLRLVLNQLRNLVARLEGQQAKGFPSYAFWIVAGWILMASYLLYVRKSPIGSRTELDCLRPDLVDRCISLMNSLYDVINHPLFFEVIILKFPIKGVLK